MGTNAVQLSKCMSMLIQISIRGQRDEFIHAPLWIILIFWIGCVAFWLRRLDKGLELYTPLFFVPVIQVAFIFYAIVIGSVYFQEFELFSVSQWLGFCFGAAMILVGVYGLAPVDVDTIAPGLRVGVETLPVPLPVPVLTIYYYYYYDPRGAYHA
jgi:hypothetical protein